MRSYGHGSTISRDKTDKDVTEQVAYGFVDGELLPIERCACGAKFGYWEHSISIYPESARKCSSCGKRFYFVNDIRVYEVGDG